MAWDVYVFGKALFKLLRTRPGGDPAGAQRPHDLIGISSSPISGKAKGQELRPLRRDHIRLWLRHRKRRLVGCHGVTAFPRLIEADNCASN